MRSYNIKIDKNEEDNLQKAINEIRNDTELIYKISAEIERVDGVFIHTEDEKGCLNEINVKFQKEFTHQE